MRIYIIFLCTLFIFGNSKKHSKKIFRITNFENCPGHVYKEKRLTVKYFTNQLIRIDLQIVNSGIEFKNIPIKPQMTAIAVKCETLVYSSCVEMWSFSFDLCSKLRENSLFYAEALNLFRPKFKCPIKDGLYKSVNYTGDPEKLYKYFKTVGLTDVFDGFMGIRFVMNDERKKEIGCIDGRLKFYELKSKNVPQ